ncbi:MAG: glycosyltransferase family 2 protein [Bacteriovorax sp.]|jgi:glycosyltransferase involved in cell wall biosynthesis
MNPDITVVIPYHNEKKTIEYTLERVGKQTLPAKVAIFVNSSSTDDTFDIVNKWIEKNQSRFQTQFKNVFEQTDNPASSKNVGIRNSETEWIAFMDCGQNFEKYWLESQYQFAIKNKIDVVSGVVYLAGENWVDRCAVAQTYGYKKTRPCLPTTLVRKSVFEKTGLLLEGRRAGYDAAWPIKLKKMEIQRGINEDVMIRYIGFNFSSNLKHLFKKSIMYAKPTVAIDNYWVPYLYLIYPLLILLAFFVSIPLAFGLILLYIFARAAFLPIIKSKNTRIFQEHPWESLRGLFIVGFIIDLGKLVGIIQGIRFYYFPRST